MELGVLVDFRNPPGWRQPWVEHYARTLQFIEEADRLGAGSVFLTEHHLAEDGYLPQPLTVAAAIAARTKRIRIGTAVLLAPLRHSLHIAEEAAIVDLLSGGRLELGIGTGYRGVELAAFGVDVPSKHRAFEAQIAELRRLLSPGSEMTPPPAQERLPLWIGYNGPVGARRAGRLGEGLLSVRRGLLEPYREGLAEGGHSQDEAVVSGLINLIVADDPDQAWNHIAESVRYHLNNYRAFRGEIVHEEETISELKRGSRRVGEYKVLCVDDAVAYIKEIVAGLPVVHLLTWLSIANMPGRLTVRHLELLFTQVAPALTSVAGTDDK